MQTNQPRAPETRLVVPHHARRRRRREEMQDELFDLRVFTTRMLNDLVLLILGEEPEQRQAIDDLLDLVAQDIRLARRMVQILDANPRVRATAPDLYRLAAQAAGEA